MNSDEQREDRRERLQGKCLCPDDCNCRHAHRTNYCGCKAHFVSTLPTHAELVRKGARYCKHCGTDEAMPGHEC